MLGCKKHKLESRLLGEISIRSDQSFSRVRLFETPWIAACQASLSNTNSQSSLRLKSIESGPPSGHLIFCHPLLLLLPIPPSIRVFSNESTLPMRWPKYWSFSFSTIPSKGIPGLISFRMDWLDLLAVQGTNRLNWTEELEMFNNRCVGMGHIVPRWVGIIVLGFQELHNICTTSSSTKSLLSGYRLHHAYLMLQPSSVKEESCNILLTLAFSMVIKSIYLCILAVEQASRAYLKSASCFSWAWKDWEF